jgi:glycosyltransferase involved in cell wall biosynthesis
MARAAEQRTADGDDPPTIVLLTGNSLCHNPRAAKTAAALSSAGYRVQVLGAWLDGGLKARDLQLLAAAAFEFIPVVDTTAPGSRRPHIAERIGRRMALLVHSLTAHESPRQLGPVVLPLCRAAMRLPAELYIAHSEAGLFAARELMRHGCKVGVDMEDWFSEDLPEAERRHRPLRLLRMLETAVLRSGAYASCPSHVMAEALAAAYDRPAPTVIYNAFPWSDRARLAAETDHRRHRARPSLYWFSQTLGPGRGIEDLVAALPLLRGECDIHLRGHPARGFAEWIGEQLPPAWRGRVHLHGLAANDALLTGIAGHDIGFAGEQPHCRSRALTVTNKLLHYLLAGLPVIASNTDGQREIAAAAPQAVTLYRAGDAQDLAQRLDELIASPGRRVAARQAALAAAQSRFCWERQERRLLAAISAALRPTGAAAPREFEPVR